MFDEHQIRVHDSQLPDRCVHLRNDSRPGRQCDNQQERESPRVRASAGRSQDLHEASQGTRWNEATRTQVVRLQLVQGKDTGRRRHQHGTGSSARQIEDRARASRQSFGSQKSHDLSGQLTLFIIFQRNVLFLYISNELE